MELPQRTSLASQVVEILQQRLLAGDWTDYLPGEYELCDQLHVSRPTVRRALTALAREGCIRAEHGMGWKILSRPMPSKPRDDSKTVCLLCFVPLEQASPFSLLQIDKLQHHLNRAGCQVELRAGSQYASQNGRAALGRLVQQTRASHWVLLGPSRKIQKWFQERKLPVFVSLTAQDDISLPAIAVNLRAMYRHAVGMIVRRGLRRLVWFVPTASAEQEQERPQGFWEAVRPYQDMGGFSARMVTHKGSAEHIGATLRSLFAEPNRPDALVVERPIYALAVVTHLLAAGIRVPHEVSVVCMGYEPYLDHVTPSIAHYVTDRRAYARTLCRAVTAWVLSGRVPRQETALLPQFRDGASLAAAGQMSR